MNRLINGCDLYLIHLEMSIIIIHNKYKEFVKCHSITKVKLLDIFDFYYICSDIILVGF